MNQASTEESQRPEEHGALYFPYIVVPETAWFSNVLLYWPRVGSIVPTQFLEDPEALGGHMQRLVQEGLVTQVYPDVSAVPGFADAFLATLEEGGAPAKTAEWKSLPIYFEKLGRQLSEELVDRRLARRADGPWLEVERTTANRFMTYLACVLGSVRSVGMVPVTDAADNVPSARDTDRLSDGTSVREVVLNAVLPVSKAPLDPARLAAFKSSHGNELARFRATVEGFVEEVVEMREEEERKARLNDFLTESKEEVREIDAALQGFSWSGPTAWASAGVLATAYDLQAGLSAAGIYTVAGAVGLATSRIRKRSAARRKPMAYAVLAGQRALG